MKSRDDNIIKIEASADYAIVVYYIQQLCKINYYFLLRFPCLLCLAFRNSSLHLPLTFFITEHEWNCGGRGGQ